jgi:hypothetical protein
MASHAAEVAEIDILSADVEGWELEVIQGLSFSKYKPKVLILENLFNDVAYVEALKAKGYSRWAHIYPNDVYVREGFQGTGINRFWMPMIDWLTKSSRKG